MIPCIRLLKVQGFWKVQVSLVYHKLQIIISPKLQARFLAWRSQVTASIMWKSIQLKSHWYCFPASKSCWWKLEKAFFTDYLRYSNSISSITTSNFPSKKVSTESESPCIRIVSVKARKRFFYWLFSIFKLNFLHNYKQLFFQESLNWNIFTSS